MKKKDIYFKKINELNESIITLGALLNKYHKGIIYINCEDIIITDKLLDSIYELIIGNITPTPFINISIKDYYNNKCIVIKCNGKNIPYLIKNKAYIRKNEINIEWTKKDICKRFMNINKKNYTNNI